MLCICFTHCVSWHKHKLAPILWCPAHTVLRCTFGLAHWNKLSIFIQLEMHSIIPISRHLSTYIHLRSVGVSWYHFWKLKLSHYFMFYVLLCIVQLECFLINRNMFLWILSCLSAIFTFRVFCLTVSLKTGKTSKIQPLQWIYWPKIINTIITADYMCLFF